MTDDRTPNLDLPKPHQDNLLVEDVARLRAALDAIDAAIADRQMALGFTPEDAAKKGQPDGYAGLDGSGKVPSAQLPSYVDDVLEYDSLALFPGIGESGKIYVALDTGLTYRWGGTAYVVISASPGSTDDVTEGAVNKYFTDARARSAQLPATASTLGVVKIGSGLSVGLDGTLSALGGAGGAGVPAFNELTLVPTVNGQTVFAPVDGYGVGQIELYLNGVLLYGNGDDYTATDGVQIVLSAGLSTTDTLLLRRWTTADSLPFSAITDKPTTLGGYGITDALPKSGGEASGLKLNDGYTEEVYALGTTGSIALNPANGSIQTCALTGDPTFTDSLSAGQSIVLMLTNGAIYTVTWPTVTWVTASGNAAPTLTASDVLVFWKVSTTLYGAYVGSGA